MNFHLKSKAIAFENLPKSPEFKVLPVFFKSKGAVIKYGADRGGRDLAGPPKLLRSK